MACINKRTAVLLALLVTPTLAYGSSDNLLWRVDAEGEIARAPLPSFTGQKNPFPQRAEPEKRVLQRVAPVVQNATNPEHQLRVKRALDLLQRIRELLRNRSLFRADISNIKAHAYMNVNGQPSVLTNDVWLREGDNFDVPIQARDRLQQLLQELGELSPEMAKIVVDEIAQRMVETESFNVTIAEIQESEIILEDEEGLRHRIEIGR